MLKILNMKKTILTLALLHFALFSFSQELGYGVLPYSRTIKKEKASVAKVLSDINPRFPASWIREYVSVSLSVSQNGQVLKADGRGFELNKEQQQILKIGETGADINVAIKYYPNNTLPKEVKDMDFTFTIAPDIDAQFQDGKAVIQQYLKENAIDRLSEMSDIELHQAKVSFNINQNGDVTNAKIFERSHSAEIDGLLLTAINNMPKWLPAKNADGTLVSQAFEFIVTKDLCTYNFK